ncbi:GNAT family N-acetyltransferase [Streptomyces adustus]|uniref:GNAT family N-acetyltransferase n=1 Tax=Streptomyces adustus TaxID=1609272 RepID=A0A5N8V958_9ACTN|nr:GNAT family N-acetyltransferase [Streptomyces adustus]
MNGPTAGRAGPPAREAAGPPAGRAVAPPGATVRDRTEDDLADCVRILAEVHVGDGYPVNWPERPGTWLTPASALGAWVAEVDGRPAGHVGLCRAAEGDLAPVVWSERTGRSVESAAVVGRLFVAPGARARGIGGLLVGRAVREARRHGLHPVLDVVASDTAAAALYERLGWERLATVEQLWGPDRRVSVHCYAAPATPSGRSAGRAGAPTP